jgi:putative ABC transport system permease protein
VAAVALATALPAWRAGRVAAFPAARPSSEHIAGLSHVARLALLLRLPAALVLGARAAFHRPLRAAITVARLAIPIVMITVALGSWATLDGFRAHPQRLGLATALTATPSGIGDAAARGLLNAQPGVAAVYPGVETQALVPGGTTTITLRAVGTSGHSYPFAVVEGRSIQGPDEAVAGQGALDQMHVRVGQWVRVVADGSPYILHIVGRSIEPEHSGEILSVGFDTLSGPTGSPAPEFYALAIRPTAGPSEVRAALLAASHGQLDVQPTPSPADQLGAVRVVAAGVIVLLALVGLVELLTATSLALRDHARDVAVLRAIGLTPRQITATMATSTGLLAMTAAVTGCALGLAVSDHLINLQGANSGMGAGIAQSPPALALLITGALTVTLAATVCVIPAARAARIRSREPSGQPSDEHRASGGLSPDS